MSINLKNAFWDYDFSEEELRDLLCKRRDKVSFLTREKLYKRLLESMKWYDFLSIVPEEDLREALSDDVIKRIWPKSRQGQLIYARRILFT